jgi:asparagine synthase (glutamine-hydrolysing)
VPGIVGLVTQLPREQAERELLQMVKCLCHERFYVTGTWLDESIGIYVGWIARRGSFSDGMPLRNERGDVVLIFSGEEFPEPDAVQRLKKKGHEFDPRGADYLVHMSEDEPDFPAGLNGRFQGLLVDRRNATATLFNDRFGMQRVYYHESKESFYFAAEAKAILAVRPEPRRIDPRSMGEFVSCGCTLDGRTLFEGVRLLPGGSRLIFRKGSLRQRGSYFKPGDWETETPLSPDAFYHELRRAFSQNLPRYFAGPEKIAMSLTGGLDTRMILAWQRTQSGSLPCYTFGSMFRENHDVRVARRVSAALDQPYQTLTTGHEFLAQFPHYAEKAVFLSDGCVDVGRSPDLFINEMARQIAPVRMTGNYGGEVLRRVRTFKPVDPAAGLFDPEFLAHVHQARQTYAELERGNEVSFAVFKQLPWNHYGVMALEETQLSMRSPYLDNDVVRTAMRAPQGALASDDICLRLIADGNQALLRIPTDRGVAGERGLVPRSVLHALRELSFKAEYAYDMGMPQWLARADHALSRLQLERLYLGRHKIFHFRVWYRDALAKYVREILLDEQSLSRPYVGRRGVEAAVTGHLRGDRNSTNEIHKLLTLEFVHRLFVDVPAPTLEQGSPVVSAGVFAD